MASLFQPHYMLICSFICTPFIPSDHHKELSCYNNSSVYRSDISDMFWINSRLLDVFIWVFRIMQNLIHNFFVLLWKWGETEERSISNVSSLDLPNVNQALLIQYCLPQFAKRQTIQTNGCRQSCLAVPVLNLVDHDPASVWKLCSHISVALCPLNLAWLINSDTALYCAMHSGWWAPKSMLTSSMNTWLSIPISIVTPGT